VIWGLFYSGMLVGMLLVVGLMSLFLQEDNDDR
jgi:hypothetical protein